MRRTGSVPCRAEARGHADHVLLGDPALHEAVGKALLETSRRTSSSSRRRPARARARRSRPAAPAPRRRPGASRSRPSRLAGDRLRRRQQVLPTRRRGRRIGGGGSRAAGSRATRSRARHVGGSGLAVHPPCPQPVAEPLALHRARDDRGRAPRPRVARRSAAVTCFMSWPSMTSRASRSGEAPLVGSEIVAEHRRPRLAQRIDVDDRHEVLDASRGSPSARPPTRSPRPSHRRRAGRTRARRCRACARRRRGRRRPEPLTSDPWRRPRTAAAAWGGPRVAVDLT